VGLGFLDEELDDFEHLLLLEEGLFFEVEVLHLLFEVGDLALDDFAEVLEGGVDWVLGGRREVEGAVLGGGR